MRASNLKSCTIMFYLKNLATLLHFLSKQCTNLWISLCGVDIRHIWTYEGIDVSRIIVLASPLYNTWEVDEKTIIDKNVEPWFLSFFSNLIKWLWPLWIHSFKASDTMVKKWEYQSFRTHLIPTSWVLWGLSEVMHWHYNAINNNDSAGAWLMVSIWNGSWFYCYHFIITFASSVLPYVFPTSIYSY